MFNYLKWAWNSALDTLIAKHINGGEVYRSPTKLFSVSVPEPYNSFFVRRFRVFEAHNNKKGERQFEAAAFWIKDFGEVYCIGVTRITPADSGALPRPSAIGRAFLRWRICFLRNPRRWDRITNSFQNGDSFDHWDGSPLEESNHARRGD